MRKDWLCSHVSGSSGTRKCIVVAWYVTSSCQASKPTLADSSTQFMSGCMFTWTMTTFILHFTCLSCLGIANNMAPVQSELCLYTLTLIPENREARKSYVCLLLLLQPVHCPSTTPVSTSWVIHLSWHTVCMNRCQKSAQQQWMKFCCPAWTKKQPGGLRLAKYLM